MILSRSNIRKKTSYNYSSGFALPTILIASMIMLSVLLVSVASTAAIRVSLLSQTYNQMAQTAGDAGVVYTKACLDANGGVPLWSDAKPLGPNTDCSGNQLTGFTCPASSVDSRCYITVNSSASTAQVLVVGGGGGGGQGNTISVSGGGGGAGGYQYNPSLAVTTQAYTVTVGGGGAGATGQGADRSGANGNNSVFSTITATAGGGGGAYNGVIGKNGGSGGGGGGSTTSYTDITGLGTGSQGNRGGTGTRNDTNWASAGGGGNGSVGHDALGSTAGDGGLGTSNSISGSVVTYCAGGGGGSSKGTAGVGGSFGIGGAGATGSGTGGTGTTNTGSGGGGSADGNGGSGGSGVVIISYPTGSITATVTGSVTTLTSGNNTIQKFTGNGTFTVTSAGNGAIISSFSVGLPTLTNGKAAEINSVGSTKLLRSSTGTAWRTYSQSSRLSIPITDVIAKVLVVAGGGGGANSGSGGGAGGYVYNSSFTLLSQSYPITVGGGGIGGNPTGNPSPGTKGGNSVFSTITAEGGGNGVSHGNGAGGNGGSGAGGAITPYGGSVAPGGTGSQGNAGGTGTVTLSGQDWYGNSGGGGGAGGAGVNGANNATAPAGNGGVGLSNSITGSAVYYAGGGGGGEVFGGAVAGSGGTGGGGNSNKNAAGSNGVANTGGGGGGGSITDSPFAYNNGGNGGSGVVVISYPTGSITATGGTITTSGGNTIHTFTSSGTFTVLTSKIPTDIAGLRLWLDTSQITGKNDGDSVSSWTDSSGNGNNVVQATGSRQPIYKTNIIKDKPALRLVAASSQTMTVSTNFPAPTTVLYVAHMTGGANYRILSGLNNNWLLGFHGGNKTQAYFEGWVNNPSAAADTNWYIYSTTITGSNSNFYENRNLIIGNANGVTGPNGLSLSGIGGSSEFSNCEIAEVLVYNSALSDSDRGAIEVYLASRYF